MNKEEIASQKDFNEFSPQEEPKPRVPTRKKVVAAATLVAVAALGVTKALPSGGEHELPADANENPVTADSHGVEKDAVDFKANDGKGAVTLPVPEQRGAAPEQQEQPGVNLVEGIESLPEREAITAFERAVDNGEKMKIYLGSGIALSAKQGSDEIVMAVNMAVPKDSDHFVFENTDPEGKLLARLMADTGVAMNMLAEEKGPLVIEAVVHRLPDSERGYYAIIGGCDRGGPFKEGVRIPVGAALRFPDNDGFYSYQDEMNELHENHGVSG